MSESQPSSQFLIVGLGNPGKQYEHTRHNIGFDVLDRFAKANAIALGSISKGAQSGDGRIGGKRVALLKPMTYMNLSGEPLSQYLRNHPHSLAQIMVIVDDIHLPLGRIRIRPEGSDGGHNGLKSITAHLQTTGYPRMRIGVGEPGSSAAQVDYVLSKFSKSEEKELEDVMTRCVAALETWIDTRLDAAMNRFNGG